ncbi:PrgH/EprH family type III secretion apparatus protein [Escherichia albertii]
MDGNLAGKISVLAQYSMKILSGPMYGVDLSFPSFSSVFVHFVSQEQLINETSSDNQSVLNGLNSIVIPAPTHLSTSFLLSIVQEERDGQRLCYQIVDNAENKSNDIPAPVSITLNKPITIGQITLAIKQNGSDWSRDILLFNSLPPQQPESVPVVAQTTSMRRFARFPFYCALLLIIIAGAIAGYLYPTKASQSLNVLLSPVNPEIITLKNGDTYVITSTEANVEWGWQAINKNHLNAPGLHIVARESTLTSLETALHEMKIPFHRLELDNERNLDVIFSQERCNTVDCDKKSREFIRQHYPWINKIITSKLSDKGIVAQVSHKLTELRLQYDTDISPSHARFMLHGVLDGEQYSALEKTIGSFRQQYGVEYAQFIFGLEESRLRPLTFRSGDDSYAIISDYHWLYPY